jgi:hypothetical protein
VIVRPGSAPSTYRTPDGEASFDQYSETISVKGSASVTLNIRETRWGPVLPDVPWVDGDIAVSWTGHKPDAVNLLHLELETTTTVDEALAVAKRLGIPPQNFVCGDDMGNIGWTIAGKIPQRSEFDASLPADWSQQEGWHGWLSNEAYPQLVNPASGRIWTANARVVDGEALRKIGDGGYDLGARASQIRDGLFASELFDAKDMLSIHLDDRALFLSPWRDLLLSVLDDAAVAGNAERRLYRQLAEHWLPSASAESVGYRLVRAFRVRAQGALDALGIAHRDFGPRQRRPPGQRFAQQAGQLRVPGQRRLEVGGGAHGCGQAQDAATGGIAEDQSPGRVHRHHAGARVLPDRRREIAGTALPRHTDRFGPCPADLEASARFARQQPSPPALGELSPRGRCSACPPARAIRPA